MLVPITIAFITACILEWQSLSSPVFEYADFYFPWIKILFFLVVAGYLAFELSHAGRQGTKHEENDANFMPYLSTAAFSALTLTLHFGAWIPVELAALLSSPFVILPPFLYRVEHSVDSQSKPMMTIEEICRIQDVAFNSRLIKEFRQRYPNHKSFVYRYKIERPHSMGGLILFNREYLPLPEKTTIEITLDCPFTRKPGVMAEGREKLETKLVRYNNDHYKITPLPFTEWEKWLEGMTKKQWGDYIQSLDSLPPIPLPEKILPKRLESETIIWQEISLT